MDIQTMYDIEIKPLAEKDIKHIPKFDAIKVLKKIRKLENGLTGDIKKLTNYTPEYRLRIGNYRILFEIQVNKIIIYRIKHRKEAYK